MKASNDNVDLLVRMRQHISYCELCDKIEAEKE